MIVTQKLPIKSSMHSKVIIARYNRIMGDVLKVSDLTFSIEIKLGLDGSDHRRVRTAPTYH